MLDSKFAVQRSSSPWPAKQLTTAEAVGRIHAGQRIFLGSGAAAPQELIAGLIAYGAHLVNNEIVHLLTLGAAPYCAPEYAKRFRHRAFFIGENVRDSVRAGRADFVPIFLSEIPSLIATERCRIDVALIQVCPPDSAGMVSLGVSVDIVRAAVEAARLVIAEVNVNMPRTNGDACLHVDQIDAWVPADYALPEAPSAGSTPVEQTIAEQVAQLIPNGATLQTGIGQLPNAILRALSNHEDLGIHTEMFSDGVMQLAEAGVINGSKKTLLPGKIVSSFLFGSERLYRWVDRNPAIRMMSSDFVNDPFMIARNDCMISINSALAIDLTGQVASDSLTTGFYSGIGGQVDFIRGASRSVGGKSILALPSTAKQGALSRICVTLDPAVGVTTSRGDVRYVVTEYGGVDLWGLSIRERVDALIALAHPDFRAELRSGARRLHYST